MILNGFVKSGNAKHSFPVIASFNELKAVISVSVNFMLCHRPLASSLSNCVRGLAIPAKPLMNFLNCVAIPRNDLSCLSVLGGAKFLTADIFAGSGLTPSLPIIIPRNSSSLFAKWHFFSLSVMFASSIADRTASMCCRCSSHVPLKTTMSSTNTMQHCHANPFSAASITL